MVLIYCITGNWKLEMLAQISTPLCECPVYELSQDHLNRMSAKVRVKAPFSGCHVFVVESDSQLINTKCVLITDGEVPLLHRNMPFTTPQ